MSFARRTLVIGLSLKAFIASCFFFKNDRLGAFTPSAWFVIENL